MKTDNGSGRALAALKLAEQAAKQDTATNAGEPTDTKAQTPTSLRRSGAALGDVAKEGVSRVKPATAGMVDRFESRAKASEPFIDYASPLPSAKATHITPQAQTVGTPRRGIQDTDAATQQPAGAAGGATQTQEIPTAATTPNADGTGTRVPNPGVTTRGVGEEGAGGEGLTTLAVGEEGGAAPPTTVTTLAIGEEGGGANPPGTATTRAIGEEGGGLPEISMPPGQGGPTAPPGQVTTMAIGEEGGGAQPPGNAVTMAFPEEGGAPPAHGDVLPSVPVQGPVQDVCANNPQMQAQAAAAFQQIFNVQVFNFQININQAPAPACTPAPSMDLSCAPAGKGLTKNPEGWPQGSVRTAGGYTVVPEGKDSAWSIFAPGQKPGDKAHTRVWGDPHVSEKDGTRWDFTKSSDFVLPDGTRIAAQTTSETGKSVTQGLTISNGHERVQIDGINSASPKTGDMMSDGYAWRAQHASQNRDSFHLGGSAEDVRWFRERITDGKAEIAEVTGATFDAKQNRYEQTVDNGKKYWVDPQLRPQLGAPAFGPAFQNAMAPQMGAFPGTLGDAQWNQGLFNGLSQFHQLPPVQNNGFEPFGGLGRSFPDFRAVFQALMMLQQQLLMMQLLGGGQFIR